MDLDPVLNFAKVEVSIGYNAAATNIVLSAGQGAKLPDPAAVGAFNIVWWDSTIFADPADDPNVEIVRVTARSTDTLTVTRAQETTSASTKNTGGSTYKMILTPTKKLRDDINTQLDLVDVGATFPTSPAPVIGQWFRHTPTGRDILYQYDGANWIPMCSYGAMTVYVDNTDGADTLDFDTTVADKGGGTGVDANAFKTVQFAIDAIPGSYSGNVIINVNAEAYTEDVVFQGKAATGAFTITIQGILSSQESGTWSATGTIGSTSTQGVGTDTGAFTGDSYSNLLLLADSGTDNDYRIIDTHDNNDLTICGTFTSEPQSGETWEVFDWGTTIDSITLSEGQLAINVNDLSCPKILGNPFSKVDVNRCKVDTTAFGIQILGKSDIDTCYIELAGSNDVGVYAAFSQRVFVKRTKIFGNGASNNGIRVQAGKLLLRYGCIIDNCDHGTGGLRVHANGNASCFSANAEGWNQIRNCAVGVGAIEGGIVAQTADNNYTGNAVDESYPVRAVSDDPAWID